MAFKSWKENAYSHSQSFDEFCWYILPYRVHNGICADDSRSEFYEEYAKWFVDDKIDFRVRIDSLLYKFKELKHNDYAAGSLPLLSIATFKWMKRGLCDDRCKFNMALLSALGVPVVQDCVPAWGNLNNGHSWNAIVLDGNTYPFEPFWFIGKFRMTKNGGNTILFDLKEAKKISKIVYVPYTKSYLHKNSDVELFYWNKHWISAGHLKNSINGFVTFDKVPEGTFYKIKQKGSRERIFIYENGIVEWY